MKDGRCGGQYHQHQMFMSGTIRYFINLFHFAVSPLFVAVCGEVDALEVVLGAGAFASSPDIHGGYPLHYAAQMCGGGGRLGLAVLRTLLAHNVEVNVTDQDGRQPILWAASAGTDELSCVF